ncbi:hypothetical protein GGR55DRAFT_188014 [Xylaria sp. FL0064]|nr:hypothetical protein GGR55DRAFT_188014 [Xylaria sp. FL0064]
MFKRKWSALPAEAEFPSDLRGLGYFINKDDEVRSIENEDNYFKYFLSRNLRLCDRQRFAMNQACQAEVLDRLMALGLLRLSLPLGVTPSPHPNVPNIPLFITSKLRVNSRVVIIFGETHQDLGVLAHRVLGGPGGVDKGSLVSVVRALLEKQSSPTDPSSPGIILANMGELIWWPEGLRTLNRFAFDAAPMRSAAHIGNYVDPKLNHVHENENPLAHVKYILEKVVPALVNPNAELDIIGLGDGADVVESYLNSDTTWERIGDRINCFASVGGQFPSWDIKCDGLREFLKDRARAYAPSTEPLGLVLSGPSGNPHTTTFTSLGCPVFSAGEPEHVETLFIASHTTVLDWLQEVADTPAEKKPYVNPAFTVDFSDAPDSNDSDDWNMGPAKVLAEESSDQEPGKNSGETNSTEDRIEINGMNNLTEGLGLTKEERVKYTSRLAQEAVDKYDGKESAQYQHNEKVMEENGGKQSSGTQNPIAKDDVDGDGRALNKSEEQGQGDRKYVMRPKKNNVSDRDEDDKQC